ncbi:MYND-type domain-containing protein [Mycena sanguinolenta]|uniref:MYND-type domain-containing protein n=1 Tax=Mycena sanguinolenta TaxID=230812 RepID=A0A8H6XHR8_9AGAR|nr:MYND-type domain-containing protein [Mycena sanguinolenta]
MQYVVGSGAFDSFWSSTMLNSWQMAASLVLYGFYLNLFLLSLYTLSRQRTAGNALLIGASCTVAVFASTHMALDVAATSAASRALQQSVHSESETLLRNERSMMRLELAQGYIFGINNFITDCIFLYRCYVIWGSQKTPLILPVLLMLATLITAILGTASKMHITITFALSAATNIVLTALTGKFNLIPRLTMVNAESFLAAGRILWIQRAAASYVDLDRTVRGRCTRAVVVILESGAVYCAMAIVLIISYTSADTVLLSITCGMGHQLTNIIPTFTLVYIGLKNMVDSNRPRGHRDVEIGPDKARVLSENKVPPSLKRAQLRPWMPALESKPSSDSSNDQVIIVIGPC